MKHIIEDIIMVLGIIATIFLVVAWIFIQIKWDNYEEPTREEVTISKYLEVE